MKYLGNASPRYPEPAPNEVTEIFRQPDDEIPPQTGKKYYSKHVEKKRFKNF